MAAFTWTYDPPSGTYKNHTISNKLRYAAIASTEFLPHVRPEPGYGKNRGDTVTLTRVRNITEPTSGKLVETQKIPTDPFALSVTSVTVNEYGRGVEYFRLADMLSEFSLENPIQKALKDQMRLTLDTACAVNGFKPCKIKFTPTTLTGGTFATNGVAGAQALYNLNYDHLGLLRDYLRETIHCPPAEDGRYIGIFSTKASRGIKQDPNFFDITKYLKPGDLVYKSEIGVVEQIRIIENTHTNALSSSLGLNSVLGEALIFGEDAAAMAEVETPELRMAIPADAGRQQSVVWYGILEFGIIWDTANDGEARIIHVTST